MDCLCGILSNNLKDLVCVAVNQLRYPCCFNNFVKELEKEEHNLIATRRGVKERVDHAKKQTLKTAEVIHKWLEDADIGEADVKNLLIKAKSKKSCCFGHCPNWILRYHFGRKLANKKNELQELIKKGEPFVQLERVATLPSETLYFPSDKYLKFESRESAFKQVMEAVKGEEVNKIGLYGMGGCGKTTLAEEVKKIAEAEHRFDKVLFVAVSSTVEVRRIQEKIASSLQYDFQVNEEKERATALCQRLTEEKKILVIFDDVWQRLDFGAIGIPPTEHHKGCKVLITTRSEDVCTLMDCQEKIQLQILTDDEAWNLFQKQAQISEDASDSLEHLAREISDECKGLPVAIAAVAGSLKGKNEVIWKVALNRLRNSKPMNIEKGLRDPYNCLQLSYDNLDTQEAKSLFLLCSVFPEDFEIPTKDLIKLAIGLGVVGEVRSYDEAKSEVIAAKIKLVSSCLLMLDANYHGYECVKMHDLVRDVAHLIAKDENKVIKCQLDNDVTLEQSSIRYLWCKEFPNDLDCSNLEFLCIATKLEVLDEIFKRMGKLRVLRLINNAFWDKREKQQLSTKSFTRLANLRSLFLVGWELSDISFVRDTKKLQSLSLYRCSLPSFLDSQTGVFYKQLTKLKLLELMQCEMERNNYNVIGRIPQLEELRIMDDLNRTSRGWNEDTIELFKTFDVPQALQCYGIILGNFDDYANKVLFSSEGILSLNCFPLSNEAIKGLAKRAKVLQMGNIEGGAKNIIPDVFEMKEGSLKKLNELDICDSEEIECLVDTNNYSSEVGTLFSELLKLGIFRMDNLRILWDGCLPPRGTFQKLKELRLRQCPELTSLFTHTAGSFALSNLTELELEECPKLSSLFSIFTAKSLISLQKLSISDCHDLKHIITAESGHKNEKKGMVVDDHDLKNVISIFPSLKSVYIIGCEINFPLSWLPPEIKDFVDTTNSNDLNEKETLFSQLLHLGINFTKHLKVLWDGYLPRGTFQKLETLHLEGCSELTYLFTCSPGPFTLSNLTEVWVESCEKLRTLFTVSTAKTLTSLKELSIRDCDDLEHIVTLERGHQNEHADIVEHDHDLQSVISMFPNLKKVDIVGCPKLEVIFPQCYLPESVRLDIGRCPELKQLMEQPCQCLIDTSNNQLSEVETLFSQMHRFQKLETQCPQMTSLFSAGSFTLSNLTELVLEECPKLSSLFSIFTAKSLISLQKLSIYRCDDLKHIVTPESGHKNEKEDIVEHDHDLQSVISMFPNLKEVFINRCAKLEVIFPPCCLPELVSLEISECIELKQIMEQDLNEDKNLSNLVSSQPRFPKLTKLVVEHCHKLKRVFSTSASIGLSNLAILIINGAAELEELFGSKHGKGHEIQKAKVELPKLKLMIFMNLPNLCQGNELLAVKHRFVHNCPKLALISTTTLWELKENFPSSDFENAQLSLWEINYLFNQIKESDEVLTSRDTSELPLLQFSEKSEDSIEEVEGSEVEATITSTDLELNGRLSPNPLDICQRETNIELVDQESSSEAGFSDKHEPEDTINIEDIRKESIQELSVSEGPTNKTLSTVVEGISLGDGVGTHTKSSGGGIIAQGSQVVEIDDKLDESKTVTRTRLEAYKRFVDLDDTQIALLVETIATYPHLWNSCQKFRERFKAWMLKTLADMLLFLRNESASGFTPQKEKEFHKLCDEAIELGFDSSWVDEMRQHIVVARDPKLEEDPAQSQINELFKRSTGADMVLDSQVVKQGGGLNEHCTGTSQCQEIQNVDNSIKEGSNLLIDKSGEIGLVPNDCGCGSKK